MFCKIFKIMRFFVTNGWFSTRVKNKESAKDCFSGFWIWDQRNLTKLEHICKHNKNRVILIIIKLIHKTFSQRMFKKPLKKLWYKTKKSSEFLPESSLRCQNKIENSNIDYFPVVYVFIFPRVQPRRTLASAGMTVQSPL